MKNIDFVFFTWFTLVLIGFAWFLNLVFTFTGAL